MIKYIELKTGNNDDGPAWISEVQTSRSGKTLFFNDMALASRKGQGTGANYYNIENDDEYWVSNVKKDGKDRHWAGHGVIFVQRSILNEYLGIRKIRELCKVKYIIVDDIKRTNIDRFHDYQNSK